MSRIVITGAGGQLGRELARLLADRSPVALDRSALDIGDPSAVEARLRELAPDVVLNAAAFNLVDAAEERVADAFQGNAAGPYALARACRAAGALLVHFSTDYVFDGRATRPYSEEAPPAPQSVYATSKLGGELLVQSTCPLHMVIRTAGLYGAGGVGGKGGNFVETMLRLGAERKAIRVVADQRTAPTSTRDLARKVVELLDRWTAARSPDWLGLYHATNSGSCSWQEFANEIFRQAELAVVVEPISSAEYGAKAPRPAYSVLEHGHLKRLGIDDLRDWREALADYLQHR
jgi:dTDP-4-dehydrorhamnose reductase